MATSITGSFTSEGISSILTLGNMGEDITWSVSGTFSGAVLLEREVAPGGLAWLPLSVLTTPQSGVYRGRPKDRLRFRCVSYVSGTVSYSLADEDAIVYRMLDADGNLVFQIRQSGIDASGFNISGASVTPTGGSAGLLSDQLAAMLPKAGGTVTGTLTLGSGGSGGQRLQASGTGNWVLQLGGSSSLWNFQSSGGLSIAQIGGASNQLTSMRQIVMNAQGGASPVWTGTSISAMTPWYASLGWSGTVPSTGNNAPLLFSLTATTSMDASASQGTVGGNINFSSLAGYKGPAHALNIVFTQSGTAGQLTNTYTALNLLAQMTTNDGGTALVSGSTGGGMCAFNPVAHWGPNATFTTGGSIAEFDIYAEAGSGLLDKTGILITQIVGDAVQGTRDDTTIQIDSQSPTTVGTRTILGIGSTRGYSPMDATNGWVMQFLPHGATGTIAAAGGLDFNNLTPTTAFMRGSNFLLDPSGNWKANSYKVGSNQVVGARVTGWGAGTNGSKSAFNGSTATLAQTSAALAQLIADLTTHGLIGA